MKLFLLGLLLVSTNLPAQERSVDPTWLHRFVPSLAEARIDLSTPTCRYTPIFGEGDAQNRALQNISRFGEITLSPKGSCNSEVYERREEIYFILSGAGNLHYENEAHPLRQHDFTYLAPGVKHSIENSADQPLIAVVMSFEIPKSIAIGAPAPHPTIVNLGDLKEETVQGHPTSVQYRLMVGPRSGTRDAIDAAYIVTSLFWMDFVPGGTNFPHHHESAEESYLVIDGEGDMVAGGGMDGIEGRHAAKTGDAYYFRPNCTVGFYNQKKDGAKAYILAVRSRVLFHDQPD
ncbi:MAG: cupin domain-containing protein [Acidobacteria bacterium]|nr:MAG: cupin domain-containing protein [Acidobacteriota bacterium]